MKRESGAKPERSRRRNEELRQGYHWENREGAKTLNQSRNTCHDLRIYFTMDRVVLKMHTACERQDGEVMVFKPWLIDGV